MSREAPVVRLSEDDGSKGQELCCDQKDRFTGQNLVEVYVDRCRDDFTTAAEGGRHSVDRSDRGDLVPPAQLQLGGDDLMVWGAQHAQRLSSAREMSFHTIPVTVAVLEQRTELLMVEPHEVEQLGVICPGTVGA